MAETKAKKEEQNENIMSKQVQYTADSGTTYTLQHPGVLNWVRKRQQLTDIETKQFDEEQLLHYIHEHVIVDPKVDFDYWNYKIEDFEDVVGEARRFLRGVKKK